MFSSLCEDVRAALLNLVTCLVHSSAKSARILLQSDEAFQSQLLLRAFLSYCRRVDTVVSSMTRFLRSQRLNPLSFGGHLFQYTPFKDFDPKTLSAGDHRVLIMQNLSEHPGDVVKKRLASLPLNCMVIASNLLRSSSPHREYLDLESPRIQKEQCVPIEWNHIVEIHCREERTLSEFHWE